MFVSIALAAALLQSGPSLAYQLTYSINDSPDPSPDGKQLVFLRMIEGREQLFIMDADGHNERQITHDAAEHEDPAWSPDGKRIAYVRGESGDSRVNLINIDGTGDRALTPRGQHAIHPSWTPDGMRLLYCNDDDLHPPAKNEAAVLAIDVASGKVTTLISGGVNTYPIMSPDGRRIAYRHMVGEMNSEVYLADADGSHIRNLTNHPSFEGWPSWSPDGSRIAFGANRNGRYQIFLMNADGSNVHLLANTEGRATAPKWARDGSHIYFVNCRSVDYGVGCEIMRAPVTPQAR
jgi:TolB protein